MCAGVRRALMCDRDSVKARVESAMKELHAHEEKKKIYTQGEGVSLLHFSSPVYKRNILKNWLYQVIAVAILFKLTTEMLLVIQLAHEPQQRQQKIHLVQLARKLRREELTTTTAEK